MVRWSTSEQTGLNNKTPIDIVRRQATRCSQRPCCGARPSRGAAGRPLCATVCVCLLCTQTVLAQTPVSPPAAADTPPNSQAAPKPPTDGAPEAPPSVEESPSDDPPPQESSPPDKPPSEAPADKAGAVSPPKVIQAVEAVYPPEALRAGDQTRVELLVTVHTDGTVGDVSVALSGGEAFDNAAVTAMRQWRFEPARQGTNVIESRIRVPFKFSLPEVEPAPEVPPPSVAKTKDNADPHFPSEPLEVTVHGERELRAEERSVSDFKIERDVLASAPRQEGAEILRTAPGIYIGRGEGPAIAHKYMLRGFDADHGQDIEFRVGGLPINMPSHIHGQGYSDLGFLIGDVVSGLRVTEGVYDPRQGDFAVAGSFDLRLGVAQEDRGILLRSSYGSWNTFKQLALWAPREAQEETFGAVQFMRTDGFGENRAGQSGSGIFQHRFGEGDLTFRAIGILHAARSDLAGVLRQEDIDSGEVCFTCSYPYPTAEAQNALNNRFIGGIFADSQDRAGANGQFGLWLGYDSFRAQTNNTGFVQQSRTLERVAGRGDLIEQQNRTLSLGLTSRYRTAPSRPTSWAHGTLELGADGRVDIIDQAQNLLDASVRNQTWDRRVDASVRGVDLGVWGDLDWCLTSFINVRAGLRADVLSYDIEDRLGNFVPLTRPQDSFIAGFRRSAMGLAWGPRTSAEFRPTEWLSVLAAYGEGYRSPQARLLDDGEETPFTKVRSADFGVRTNHDALSVSLAGFYTHLSDDVAFDAAEGRLERIGATERLGAVAYAVTRPTSWLVGSTSLTVVDAALLEPPPATAEEPQPPFVAGQNLPFVPPVVVRADLGAKQTLRHDLGGAAFGTRAGLGFSFLSARPLPYGDFAEPVALLDASAGLTWGPAELSFELFNLFDSQYAAVERTFASDWDPNDGVRPRVPARHTAAGAPLSWLISLGVTQ